jgi:hypothetical protein
MAHYKKHPIYVLAVPRAHNGWSCKGLVFEPEEKVKEIKRFDCADLTFATKKKAEEHALKICRTWIDEQSVKD